VDGVLRELCGALLPESERLAAGMAERIRVEVPFYRDGELVPDRELDRSCAENLRYVLGHLAGTPGVDRGVPHATGTARAEQGVPYAAVLQAYRIGGRFIWELLVEHAGPGVGDALLRSAADVWAVTDDLSGEVTDAYRTALVDLARRDTQRRAALLGVLLDGDNTVVEQLWESAAVLDLPRNATYVVVSAECPSPATEALPQVEEVLRRRNVASAWRLDNDRQDGLVALRTGFDVADLTSALAELARGRIGLSGTFTRTNLAKEAQREARTACAAATPGSQEVVRYDEHPLPVLLASSPESSESLVRRVLGPVLELPEDDRAVVLDTARVWLAAAGSTSAAAKQLHLHRNTVRYRLRRLEELTGRDLAHPVQAAELYVALESARILGLG